MYVSAKVNGQSVRALLDTGATHNFVSVDKAKRLGLKATKEGGTMKAVNSPAKPIAGIAQGVHIMLGTWSGKLDFSIVPMDDFKMVLGIRPSPCLPTARYKLPKHPRREQSMHGTYGARKVRGEDTLRHAIQKGFQEGPKLFGLHSGTK